MNIEYYARGEKGEIKSIPIATVLVIILAQRMKMAAQNNFLCQLSIPIPS
jgi:hypothetical protein